MKGQKWIEKGLNLGEKNERELNVRTKKKKNEHEKKKSLNFRTSLFNFIDHPILKTFARKAIGYWVKVILT